jgi:hypothetical protein
VLALALGVVLVLVGLLAAVVAVLGGRAGLRRNRFVGVRSAATLRSDATFTAANRASAVPLAAAAALGVFGGVVLLVAGSGVLGWTAFGVAVVGMAVFAGVGGMVGERAAAAVVPEPVAAGCAGSCAGCSLVAGCAAPADSIG